MTRNYPFHLRPRPPTFTRRMQFLSQLVSHPTIYRPLQTSSRWIYAFSLISKQSFYTSLYPSDQDPISMSTPVEEVTSSNSKIEKKQESEERKSARIQLNIPVMDMKDWNSLESMNLDDSNKFKFVLDLSMYSGSNSQKEKPRNESQKDIREIPFKLDKRLSKQNVIHIFDNLKNSLVELADKYNTSAKPPSRKALNKTFRTCLDAIYLDSSPTDITCFDLMSKLKQRSVIIYGRKVSKKLDSAVAERFASIPGSKGLQPISVFYQAGSPSFQWHVDSKSPIVDPDNSPSLPSASSSSSHFELVPPSGLPNQIYADVPEGCPYIIVFLSRPSARKAYIKQFNSLPQNISDQTYAGTNLVMYNRFMLDICLSSKSNKT